MIRKVALAFLATPMAAELRSIGTLPAFDFAEVREQFAGVVANVSHDRIALGVHAKAAPTLTFSRDAVIGDELRGHCVASCESIGVPPGVRGAGKQKEESDGYGLQTSKAAENAATSQKPELHGTVETTAHGKAEEIVHSLSAREPLTISIIRRDRLSISSRSTALGQSLDTGF